MHGKPTVFMYQMKGRSYGTKNFEIDMHMLVSSLIEQYIGYITDCFEVYF